LSICEKHLWPAFKYVLLAGAPIQKLIDNGGETHLFLNNQSLHILRNDNKIHIVKVLEKYKHFIDIGNLWADKGWKCFAHYYDPYSGKGIIPWVSATTECRNYFQLALHNWKLEKQQKSMFYLGAAAHILQDMCVPHHAMGIAFNGHRKFESWALINRNLFSIKDGGLYTFNDIADVIDFNSYTSQKYYNDVSYFNIQGYNRAAKELLSLAQRTTAYLFDHFFGLSC